MRAARSRNLSTLLKMDEVPQQILKQLTQVLPYVFDIHGAVRACHRALCPGGVVLATAVSVIGRRVEEVLDLPPNVAADLNAGAGMAQGRQQVSALHHRQFQMLRR